jgi:hypothetical protein
MFHKSVGPLEVPPAAAKDTAAVEVARIWIAGGAQHVSLRPEVWTDPAAWGLFLVDLARHVANAQAARGGGYEQTLARIKEGFDVEWNHPTDQPRGAVGG